MKMLDLLKLQKLKVSSYPHPFDERAATWARDPETNSLLGFDLLDQIVPLEVGGVTHEVHVTILVDHTAVIFRGIDRQLWKTPVLCFDGEALCYELHAWRELVGLKPISFVENCSLDDVVEEVMTDPFSAALSDLAYKLEALSLIESLPGVP